MQRLIFLLILVVLLISGCAFSSNDDLTSHTTLNADEILITEDDYMYDALITKFMDANPNTLTQKQLTVATLITFDAEMMNGGLCQFFINDYSGYAQHVNNALAEVGAVELQNHYISFITQNGIDVSQMDSFRIASIQDYVKQFERFPYEAFDTTFSEIYQNENLCDLLLSYVRLHEDEILDWTRISTIKPTPICRTEQDLSWSCFFHTANRFLKHLRDEHGPEKENMDLNFFDVKAIETYGFPKNEYIYWWNW